MKFEATPLPGVLLVRGEPHPDERGSFARTWCADEFRAAGVPFVPTQMSVSSSRRAGTLRGLHWQQAPQAETKLVRVTRGRVWDVAVDLRAGSSTWGHWFGTELDASGLAALLIPPGFAHGLVTLADDTDVLYAIDVAHAPASARGARWDDPALRIAWPRPPAIVSDRDLAWPPLVRP